MESLSRARGLGRGPAPLLPLALAGLRPLHPVSLGPLGHLPPAPLLRIQATHGHEDITSRYFC